MEEQVIHPMFRDIETNHPYLEAARLLYTRLKWDLHPQSWVSRRKLKAIRNAYTGKKAVILCNGPSLNKVDFNQLEQVYTFGMNQIYLLFEQTEFRPSAIVTVDTNGIERGKEFLNKTDIPLFLAHKGLNFVAPRPNITYLHEVRTRKFARDLSMSFNGGFTVTFATLQLAYHMGFSEVALVGCDHSYYRDGDDRFSPIDLQKETFNHHFTKNYSSGFKQAFPASRADIEYNYGIARDFFEGSGRKLYNCTEGGYLELFKRMPLEMFLNS